MAHRTVVAIDVGTTKICTVVAQVDDDTDEISVLGLGLTPSKGVERGVVVNIDDTISAIASSIERAERLSGYRITAVYVAATGRYLTSLNSRAAVAVAGPDREITANDITRATEAARSITIPMQREIVFLEPRTYVVDGNEDIRDPTGMFGYRLEVEAHIVVADRMLLENLIRSVQRSGAEINEVTIQSYAASWAVLSDDDREQGVVLVDIGGGTTDFILFRDGSVRQTGVLAVGGDHITNDISIGLRVPTKWAEKLKVESAEVGPGAVSARGTVEIEDPTYAGGQIERRMLNIVAEARVRELFNLLKRRLNFERHAQFIGGGILITGGTAELKGIAALASEVFGVPARVAVPRPVMGPSILFESPRFSTAVGLVLYAQAAQEALEEISVFDRLRSKISRIIPGL